MKRSIFLIHNHQDKYFTRKLTDDLSKFGVKVWIDEAEIKIGDSLFSKIGKAIEETEYVGVILSPHSVESNWVKKELEIALDHEIKGKRVKVLPLLYQNCEIPPFLAGKLWADFRDDQKYDFSLWQILDRLGVSNEEYKKRKYPRPNLDGLKHGIIIAISITPNIIESNDLTNVKSFMNTLFTTFSTELKKIDFDSEIIVNSSADGFIAWLTENQVERIVDNLLSFNVIYKQLFNSYHIFSNSNMKVAMSRTNGQAVLSFSDKALPHAYLDINLRRLLKLLAITHGGLIFIPYELEEIISRTDHLALLGDIPVGQNDRDILCYAVIRRKTTTEITEGTTLSCSDEPCHLYKKCKSAWNKGMESAIKIKHGWIHQFDLTCTNCGAYMNPFYKQSCQEWNFCLGKYINGIKGKESICCDKCWNFKNCFINYQLGISSSGMIMCEQKVGDLKI